MRKKYIILSPDGFPIHRETKYTSLKQARMAFRNWLENYREQGYYSTIENGQRLQIPLIDVESYCELKTI